MFLKKPSYIGQILMKDIPDLILNNFFKIDFMTKSYLLGKPLYLLYLRVESLTRGFNLCLIFIVLVCGIVGNQCIVG